MSSVLCEQVINGLITGSAYALVALGLALVYGVLGVINFAHGEFYTWGAYLAFAGVTYAHLSYLPALLAAFAGGLIIGVASNRLAFAPLRRQERTVTLIASVGLSLLLSNAALLVFGPSPVALRLPSAEHVLHVGTITVSIQRLWALGIATILLFLIWLSLKHTLLGKAIRAVAEDETTAALTGLSPSSIKEITFALAAALAALSGALFAPIFVTNPYTGSMVGLKAFAVVIVGGFGNIWGSVVAALLLGIAESLATGFVSSSYSDAIAFAVMIIVLLVRPKGIVKEIGGLSY